MTRNRHNMQQKCEHYFMHQCPLPLEIMLSYNIYIQWACTTNNACQPLRILASAGFGIQNMVGCLFPVTPPQNTWNYTNCGPLIVTDITPIKQKQCI